MLGDLTIWNSIGAECWKSPLLWQSGRCSFWDPDKLANPPTFKINFRGFRLYPTTCWILVFFFVFLPGPVSRYLHPFAFPEVSEDPDFFNRALLSGLIPAHYLSNSPEEDLRSYVGTYLQEEIAAEGLARNLSAFSRFLETASTLNAKLINYTNVANDAQVPRPTVRLWFQILYDTMIAYELQPFTSTLKRKAISTAKFYFFDIGVTRMLRRIPPPLPESSDFGELFEQYIFLELKAYIDYFQPGSRITYWRSTSGYEVDFIINNDIAIEVKTAQLLQERHLTGLQALREENLIKRFICVCREDRPRWIDGILVLPWQEFLQRLWAQRLF